MSNIISNIPYDQIPHIVINHPHTTPEDYSIIICLYKVLKDKEIVTYSNEQLSIDSKVSKRSLQRRLKKLEEFGFIIMTGFSYSRRFKLGLLFSTCAKIADNKLYTRAKYDETRAKNDIDMRHGGAYTKPSTKSSTKEDLPSDFLKTQDKAHDLKMKEYQETIRKRKEERK